MQMFYHNWIVFLFLCAREERNMSELRPHHNSTYGFDTDRNLPQPNQGEVNTETDLSNKLGLQKTSKRKML